jgi:bacillithiol biosynthesis cysteine-adding enzyme BshC
VLPHSGLSSIASHRAGVRDGDATPERLAVDIRRFPWIRRLAADYAFDYERLADFFAGNPADPAAWRDAIARTQRFPRQRDAVADLLQAQQRRRRAPPQAHAAAGQLRDPQTVAIVTGQQAGLFGGPLFTLLKALTALRLAELVRAEHRVPVVTIFWIDAEDHDWDEVKTCGVLDRELSFRTIALGNPPGSHEGPVARVCLDDTTMGAVAELEAALQATEFTPQVLDGLRQAYRPGAAMVDAFAQWLESVLGPRGLVVYDSADSAAKPLVADVFAREVEQAGTTSRLAAEAGAALVERGYHAQATPHEGSLALFHLNHGREPIRLQGDSIVVGDRTESKDGLLERVKGTPHAFSPNVLLRPLIQDTLFPTACYVAGPNELAYLGQLRRVYATFGVPMPLIQQRATATILDSNAMRFLARHEFPLESLRARDEASLNELLEAQLPPSVEASLRDAQRAIEERMTLIAKEVPQIDPTLEGAARSTLSRMQDDLKKLHAKIIQAAKRRDETLRRQYRHAQAQAFPDGHPQERGLGFVYFLNKYGPALVDRLSEELPIEMGRHWVLTI